MASDDDRGEEIRRRNEEAIRGLESLDEIGDEDEQRETLDALLKALDEGPAETPPIDPATGRLRPMTAEELRARSAELRRALDDIADITDETDTDEVWDDVFRGLDESRRPSTKGRPDAPGLPRE